MTAPRLAYNPETGEVVVLRLPESPDDLGKPTDFIKIGYLAPGLSDEEFRAAMLENIREEGLGLEAP
jgi:hypothetical protein